MSDQDTHHYQQWREQVSAVFRLQNNEQEDAKTEKNEKVQVGACPYLVLMACCNAMYSAYQEHDKEIAQRDEFPQLECCCEADGMEYNQLAKWIVEQIHLPMKESVA